MITERLAAAVITGATGLLTGAQARWLGCGPDNSQRVYFCNHTSHIDFVLIWSVLPRRLRESTRPVAANDYWGQSAMRRYVIHRVFHGVLIERRTDRDRHPIEAMCQALNEGASLILFPEGTRGNGSEVQAFKPGIFHLAEAYSMLELIPVWIDNSYRVMPKGMTVPIPLLCSVAFGQPLRLHPGEQKQQFLDRVRQSLIALGNQ